MQSECCVTGLPGMFIVNFLLQTLTELNEATTVSRRPSSDSQSAVSTSNNLPGKTYADSQLLFHQETKFH